MCIGTRVEWKQGVLKFWITCIKLSSLNVASQFIECRCNVVLLKPLINEMRTQWYILTIKTLEFSSTCNIGEVETLENKTIDVILNMATLHRQTYICQGYANSWELFQDHVNCKK